MVTASNAFGEGTGANRAVFESSSFSVSKGTNYRAMLTITLIGPYEPLSL